MSRSRLVENAHTAKRTFLVAPKHPRVPGEGPSARAEDEQLILGHAGVAIQNNLFQASFLSPNNFVLFLRSVYAGSAETGVDSKFEIVCINPVNLAKKVRAVPDVKTYQVIRRTSS